VGVLPGNRSSVFVLRRKDPLIPRPYKVSGFPVPTIIFCAFCIFMLYNSVTYAMAVKPVGLITVVCVLLAGVVVYWFTEVGREKGQLHKQID